MSVPIERNILAAYCIGKGINIGCGKVPLGNSIGVDIDSNARAVSVVADGRKLPFFMGELDYVLALHNLEHYDCSPLIVLREWHRVLKPGGKCAVIVPDGDRGAGAWYYPAEAGKFYEHFHIFTLDTLASYFEAAGFDVERCVKVDRRPESDAMTLLCVGVKP